jgi:hypothetical protein
MKTYRGSTVTTARICNLSRKWRCVISHMHQLLQQWGKILPNRRADGAQGWSDILDRKSLASAKKQTRYGPASRLSLY